jgi:hypothetical protein
LIRIFNFDFHVSFTPEPFARKEVFYNFTIHDDVGNSEREGVSVFYKDPTGSVFHTYSTYERGIDMVNTAYHYLDLVPKGRDEAGLDFAQVWVRITISTTSTRGAGHSLQGPSALAARTIRPFPQPVGYALGQDLARGQRVKALAGIVDPGFHVRTCRNANIPRNRRVTLLDVGGNV